MVFEQLLAAKPVEFAKEFISFVTDDSQGERIALQYFHDAESRIMYARVTFGRRAQGPPGHAHGGAIAAVFDELMGACCWVHGYPAMTAQYTTRYFKPLPLHRDVLFEADIVVVDGNKISLKARVSDGGATLYAEAKGLFILQDLETFKRMSHLDLDALNQYHGLENQSTLRKD